MLVSGSETTPVRSVAELSILVVDDDPDVCEYLQDFLTSEGYAVTVLGDATLVLDRLKETGSRGLSFADTSWVM